MFMPTFFAPLFSSVACIFVSAASRNKSRFQQYITSALSIRYFNVSTDKIKRIILFFLLFAYTGFSQKATIHFYAVEAESFRSIEQLQVHLPDTILTTYRNHNGSHRMDVPLGAYNVELKAENRQIVRLPLVMLYPGEVKDLGHISFAVEIPDEMSLGSIFLTSQELDSGDAESRTTSTYLYTDRDVFYRTVAFQFSESFFKPRGLDSSHQKVLINDIEMNKPSNGRPLWSNWGGLNDVMRKQTISQGVLPLDSHFGGLIGSTNISTLASEFSKRSRATYSFSNRTYQHRLLLSHRSGVTDNGWSYVVAFGLRRGLSGIQEGTFYDAVSALFSMDQTIASKHHLNLTAIYSPTRRGRGSSYTKEVAEIKGNNYNSYWGFQNNKRRNARVFRVREPIFVISHQWAPKPALEWQTSIAHQFGEIGNSRLDYPGGVNPDPTYYQKLPSYFLSSSSGPDYQKAYEARLLMAQDGTLDWESMYLANQTKTALGKPAAYTLYEDRNDQRSFALSSTIESQLGSNRRLSLSLRYRRMQSENFATPIDLLGGLPLLNIDSYDQYAFDLDEPSKQIGLGDPYRYHYFFKANSLGVHTKFELNNTSWKAFVASNGTWSTYQRNGQFKNGAYPNTSKGLSKKLGFFEIGFKTGIQIHLKGRSWVETNVAYLKRPPSLQNSFSNPRENNHVVGDFSNKDLQRETIFSFELSYLFRSTTTDIRLTTYLIQEKDLTDVSYFFADGIGGDSTAFIQEIVHGIAKQHMGLEWGMQIKLLPQLTLNNVLALGKHYHAKNPVVYGTSQDFQKGFIDFGEAKLKNTPLAVGPQNALALGIEYQDPNFWRLELTYSHYTHRYINTSPILRTQNFLLDDDGLPFLDYDTKRAKDLLQTERLEDYGLLNITASKSWKINQKYILWFMGINNVLGTPYISGGYEQSRNANYRTLTDDVSAPIRRFGPKYWYGRDTSFFMNISFRF